MKRGKVTLMWVPSAKFRARLFSIPPSLLYTVIVIVVLSWVLLLGGGLVVGRFYHAYLTLQKQNSYLLQQKAELDALAQSMERIQQDEQVIRNFLGLDRKRGGVGGQGQGGEPSPTPLNIAPSDMGATSTSPPVNDESGSVVERARRLQSDLQELIGAMRDQRTLRDSTPSIVPVLGESYWVSSGFGWRRSPFTGLDEFHNGLDISSSPGTPIIAPADGVVTIKATDKYYGKYIEIDHGRGITTLYGHLSAFNCNCGHKVRRGEIIGYMGNTGLSTGNHLHYTVKMGGRIVNPTNYILNARANPILASSSGAEGKKE